MASVSASWPLDVEVDGKATSFLVYPSIEEARSESGGASRIPESDEMYGFAYFKAVKFTTGTISLDDIDEVGKDTFATWHSEIEKAGLGHLLPSAADGADQPIRQVQLVKAKKDDLSKLVYDKPEPEKDPAAAAAEAREVSASLQAAMAASKPAQAAPKPKAKGKARSKSAAKKPAAAAAAAADEEGKPKGLKSEAGQRKLDIKVEKPKIWGRTFVMLNHQGLPSQVGWGSYHFEEPGKVWLNYSAVPASEKLSDGSPFPKRLDFDTCNYDEETRKFTGTIQWKAGSRSRWEYDVDLDYAFVGFGGFVRMFKEHGTESFCAIRLGRDEHKYVWEKASRLQIDQYVREHAIDPETQKIINIMGETVEADMRAREAKGLGKPNPAEALNLIMGKAMQTYTRDKKADDMMNGSFMLRTGAKLGNPTRWDRTPNRR